MIFLPDISFQTGIANFVIGITRQCNFRCKYCCFSGKYVGMRTHSDQPMTRKTADQTIKFIRTHAAGEHTVFVSFYGGEALLQLDLIEYTAARLLEIFGKRVELDISTNGWLLTMPTVERLLRIPRAAISVSLDGIREIHDKYRVHISGTPTFYRIVGNLKAFQDAFPDEYKKRIRILMTMGSLDDVELADTKYKEIGGLLGERPLLLSHILPNFKENLTYRDSYERKMEFYRQALLFEKDGIRNLHVQMLNELRQKAHPVFESKNGISNVKLHTCLNNLESCFISTEGGLYACEKVGDRFQIGDIWHGFDEAKIRNIVIRYCLRRNLLCRSCAIVNKCHRCMADLNFSFKEHRTMCSDYIENIKLSNIFQKHDEETVQ